MKTNMKLIAATLCGVMASSVNVAAAQTSTEKWGATYDGFGQRDRGVALALDGFGNAFVVGDAPHVTLSGFLNSNWATLKYSKSGQQQWVTTFDGSSTNQDIAYDIVLDDRGNSYVTGFSADEGCRTAKYDPDGAEIWSASKIGYCRSIALDADGNVYVTGDSDHVYNTSARYLYDIQTIKYSSSGTELWSATYAGPVVKEDNGHKIAIAEDGSVIVVGTSPRAFGISYVVIKYDASGNQQWVTRMDNVSASSSPSMDMAPDGSIVVAGAVYFGGGMDAWLARINSDGTVAWDAQWAPPAGGWSSAEAVIFDPAGDVIINGYFGGWNFVLGATMGVVKFDGMTGAALWDVHYSNSSGGVGSFARGRALTIDVSGNIYATGAFNRDGNIVKLNASGTEIWRKEIAGGYFEAIEIDAKGCLVAAGNLNYDLYTLKLCQEGTQICN